MSDCRGEVHVYLNGDAYAMCPMCQWCSATYSHRSQGNWTAMMAANAHTLASKVFRLPSQKQ